jgi:hypothetical protein
MFEEVQMRPQSGSRRPDRLEWTTKFHDETNGLIQQLEFIPWNLTQKRIDSNFYDQVASGMARPSSKYCGAVRFSGLLIPDGADFGSFSFIQGLPGLGFSFPSYSFSNSRTCQNKCHLFARIFDSLLQNENK